MRVKITNEIFKERANKIHDNFYDYSLVEYIRGDLKVKIICPVHREFEQRPTDHISHKNGCKKCATDRLKKKITDSKEEVVEKFRKVHGNLYDYSKFKYTGTYGKGVIICPDHGLFIKTATAHITGSACPSCIKDNKFKKEGDVLFITETVFLERAYKKHKDKFDYSKVKYIDCNTAITIKCNIHSLEYLQKPKNHLINKGGCPKCKIEATQKTFTKDKEYFVSKSFKKHGDFYNYSNSKYTLSKNKIEIECPVHGVFSQVASDHMEGHGCYKCGQVGTAYNITTAERNRKEWENKESTLYLIELQSEKESYIKIGISREKALRHSIIERVSNCKIINEFTIDTNLYRAVKVEQKILKEEKLKKYIPIIKYPGYTECFKSEYKDYIKNEIINYLEDEK